jgi:hypothetical protein
MEGMKQRPKDGRKDVRSADLAIFHSDTLLPFMTHPNIQYLRWGLVLVADRRSAAVFLEQFPRHRDLGHLEDDVPCTRFEQTSLHWARLVLQGPAGHGDARLDAGQGHSQSLAWKAVRSWPSERLKRRNENILWPPHAFISFPQVLQMTTTCLELHCLFFVSTLSG